MSKIYNKLVNEKKYKNQNKMIHIIIGQYNFCTYFNKYRKIKNNRKFIDNIKIIHLNNKKIYINNNKNRIYKKIYFNNNKIHYIANYLKKNIIYKYKLFSFKYIFNIIYNIYIYKYNKHNNINFFYFDNNYCYKIQMLIN